MTSPPPPTNPPGRGEPAGPAAAADNQAVLQALQAACRRHAGPVTVMELVWAWAADLWWDTVTDPKRADPMTIPHTPSRTDLARVRRRLADLHRQGLAVGTGHPGRWQPLESSNGPLDDSVQVTDRPVGRSEREHNRTDVPLRGGLDG